VAAGLEEIAQVLEQVRIVFDDEQVHAWKGRVSIRSSRIPGPGTILCFFRQPAQRNAGRAACEDGIDPGVHYG